jgi:putative ABC transport system ATP-binding protein
MIELKNVSKRFQSSDGPVHALVDVSLAVQTGEFVVVRGGSGSGKTTLLLLIGGMLAPSEGEVHVADHHLNTMNEAQRARFRSERLGFVFQMFHLIPYLSVLENVMLASDGSGSQEASRRAQMLLNDLGMGERIRHRPGQLSAGEKQRTALARAMMHKPDLILADEPTGNLDPDRAADVFEGLRRYNEDGGTVVVVTHGQGADAFADRVIRIEHGRLDDAAVESGTVTT